MADFNAQILVTSAHMRSGGATPPGQTTQILMNVAEPDVSEPVVDNFSPPSGTEIQAADPIFFDVTDDTGLFRRVLIAVAQGEVTELAHDGDSFLEPYVALSTRTNIDGGFRYRLRRSGGWLDPVTPIIFAIDPSGNENG